MTARPSRRIDRESLMTTFSIERLDAQQTAENLPGLVALLQDSVDSGASVGYLPPLSDEDAMDYWHSVIGEVQAQARILWIARQADRLIGTVQLYLEGRPNGRHRAEVQKLLVHTQARRQGVGRALMAALEAAARAAGRSLLVLDTRQGDASELLYAKIGYIKAGTIPDYARSADGGLAASVFYYRRLESLRE